MAQNTDLIREKLDVAEFIKQYVVLTPAGKNLRGICPFHKEKSPSFVVSPDRQIWHCFGCGAGGDIFGFLMRFENIEFVEALKILAERAGISIAQIGNSDQKKYDTLYEINRVAKDFFKASLSEDLGRPTMNYLLERGLKNETISEFEIGLALPTNDALTRHLTKMGFSVADVEQAGIAFKTDRGTYWDRFRNRIMFPLYNHFGKVIGFTGRVMPGNESADIGKYVNSPETPIYNKSKVLYGFFRTKNDIRSENSVVVVEGQMDFLMAYQDGIKNLVATSGTALTPDHLKTVRRLAENIILSFDNDSAGRSAAERTIDLAEANDFNVKVILAAPGSGKDPADIVREHPGTFKNLVTGAVSAMEYYFDFYGVSKQQPIAERKKSVRDALLKIKVISSPVEKQHWLGELALRAGFSEAVLTAEMNALQTATPVVRNKDENSSVSASQDGTMAVIPSGLVDRLTQRLLSLILLDESLGAEISAEKDLIPSQYQPILNHLLTNPKGTLSEDIAPMVNMLYLQTSLGDESKIKNEWKEVLVRLRSLRKNDQKKDLQERIRRAEQEKDEVLLQKLLGEYSRLTRTAE
jgi:DNA primase